MTKKHNCKFVEITPAMAEDFLKHNRKNRKLNETRIKAYASVMKRGEWFAINQGIAFDKAGNLLDGQHRLMAIIHANKPVIMLVVEGLDSASQLVIDQPLVRRFHDQIGLQKGRHVTFQHIAAAKQMMVGITASLKNQKFQQIRDILTVDRFYTKHHGAIEFALSLFSKKSVRRVSISPVFAVIARAAYDLENRDRLREFAEVLITGMAQSQSDVAAVQLRNYLLNLVSTRYHSERIDIYKRTELALQGFLNNDPVPQTKRLTLDHELFPIPGDKPVVESSAQPKLVKRQATGVSI
jgi:hypothetical protein